ncbi:YfhO family protein [Staphylococcus pseudintermedius]|uniref:YfhO family protein n=1 Tax=Staphylococcus pseudintermedius TaxID=283734 RepID=UPI001BDE44FE|nr:YfhO family protein [Staphylococcus pseudintermedius]EJJ6353914.1 YfhO family protein [Staphylococcus pseudintermedius]MDK3917657.1 YfhO family protein [Staphylococcus pseudintermedius]
MKKHKQKSTLSRFLTVFIVACLVGCVVYLPVVFRFIQDGIIYSGNGDGFKQMMPFQLFLYEHFSQFHSFYDSGFGLGGDYFTDLAYYYTTSPMMYLNFIFVGIGQWLLHFNPSDIEFWPSNQIFTAYLRCIFTFLAAYGMFRNFKLERFYSHLGAFLYATSSVVYYFNFTWSFFGDILIYLPLSIWGIERFFRSRRIGLFIVAIALTLFSNFYFSYYEAIILTVYLVYRMIWQHPDDQVKRWQKLYLLIPAVLCSLCIASFGFFTGVRSFLNNDRQTNDVFISPIIDFSQKYHIFTNGFYITVTFIAVVALCSFQLYRHYHYKMVAILTWLLIIGSFSPYFDSAFNGFSFPQRRWVYILALTTSALITLWIKHFTELTVKVFLQSLIPVGILGIATLFFSRGAMWWMLVSVVILVLIAYHIYKRRPLTSKMHGVILILFVLQQFVLLINYHHNNIAPYQSTMQDMKASKYHSAALQQQIDTIKKHQSPLQRIDYMSTYAVNSSMIYHFNGVALYSSIFDGDIYDYYDRQMQINMEYDSNSTYRLLGDRENLYALWGITDRIKKAPDHALPYGMKKVETIQDPHQNWTHSHQTIDYPSAHLTSRVYDAKDLKSPLDREQAMLQGVVLDNQKANQTFHANPNLLPKAKVTPRDASIKGKMLKVRQQDGGVDIQLPKDVQQRYHDYYIEMDIELLSPNQPHYLKLDDFYQRRTKLDYAYRRYVTPITVRVPVRDTVKLKLKQGDYRFQLKGIYGEDYSTLKRAASEVAPVKVETDNHHLTAHFKSAKDQYLVLPTPYRKGLNAEVNGETRPVLQGNGLMTVVLVEKGDSEVTLTYELPYWRLLTVLTVFGLIGTVFYRWWLRRQTKVKS